MPLNADLEAREFVLPSEAAEENVRGIAFSRGLDSLRVAAVQPQACNVLVWNVQSSAPHKTPECDVIELEDWDVQPLRSVTFVPGQERLIVVGGANVVCWDLEKRKISHVLGRHGWFTAVALSHDGKLAATADTRGKVKIWDVEEQQVTTSFQQASPVHSLRFIRTEAHPNLLLMACEDGRVHRCILDGECTAAGQSLDFVLGPGGEGAGNTNAGVCRSVILDGGYVLGFHPDAGLELWDCTAEEADRCGVNTKAEVGKLRSAAYFVGEKNYLATGSDDATVRLWLVIDDKIEPLKGRRSGEDIILRGHTGSITSIAFSWDGARVVTGCEDKAVKPWDTTRGREIMTLERHTEAVTHAAFFHREEEGRPAGSPPREEMILSASKDGQLTVRSACRD
jgi:WD40 repeat protein